MELDSVVRVCSDGLAATPCPPLNADACATCVVSAETDTRYGAFIRFMSPQIVQSNPAGCIAAVSGDSSSTGCGAIIEASALCTIEACRQCPNLATFTACHADAAKDPRTCKPRIDAADACLAAVDPRVRAACYGPSNETFFASGQRIALALCGDPPGDAGSADGGSDVGSDATTD
jgi:hypothetical protein